MAEGRASTAHGSITAFDGEKEDWVEYAERLENYFIANDIDDENKKRAILLNGVGATTYRLIKTLALPGTPKDLSFDEIVKRVKLHFNPKPSPIVRRFEFNTRGQKEGEAVSDFVTALRKIAEHCEFGDVLEDMLRDRIVCGIRNKRTQQRLLQEAELTYGKAHDIALAAETAQKNSERLQDSTAKPSLPANGEAIHRVQPPRNQRKPTSKGQQQWQQKDGGCSRCGGNHQSSTCKFKDYECRFCKKKGHLAAVCWKKSDKNKAKREQANRVEEEDEEEVFPMYRISQSPVKPVVVNIAINNHPVEMELDTGASVSLMSEEDFQELQGSGVTLQPSSAKLFTYTGDRIQIVGQANVKVDYKGQEATLPLLVTKDKGPPLLGRNWLQTLKLDWKSIFTVSSDLTLQTVLEEFSEVFKEELGMLKGVTAKIYTDPGATPSFHSARPVAYSQLKKVEAELERLQSQGIIEPVQFSDWAAPIVPVPKSDGNIRICGDYKVTINRAAKLDKYPIPRINDLFASLAGGKTFSKLDLSHAYQQIQLDEESRQYVTINTHRGLFRYNRLPFGVSSAPSIFQRVMETLLQGIPGVCVYLDDILITGHTEAEHLENLTEVLRRLAKGGMRLKKNKCAFMLDSVDYLGHTISADGLRTSEAKIKGIVNAPTPQNVSELRSFLGLVNYYGKFLPDLATILAPLYSLLRKHKRWHWGKEQEEAFEHVKQLLLSSEVLVHFDDRLPVILSCDASPYGLGAVLSHLMPDGSERPIAFASKSLTATERKYSQLDKEAMAIVYGVKKYHQYVYGRQFTLKTDHKPLTYIFGENRGTPTMASGRIQRWALTLGAYNYRIEYKKGEQHANADAMSRLPQKITGSEPPIAPEVVHLMEFLDTSPVSSKQIRWWTDRDPLLSKVRRWVLSGWPEKDSSEKEMQPFFSKETELSVEEGCLLWGSRVVVPSKGRSQVVKMLHEAHPGIVRMKRLARSYVWWPGMDGELEECVKRCTECQTQRKTPPVTPMHPWSWPEKPWSRIHVDYAGPFMGKMFLLLIDAHSKWLEVHMTTSSTSSATIELMRKSFATLGLPRTVVSDNGTAFTSGEFTEFLKTNGIKHVKTPPYHPASNGMVERAVQTFKEGMKKMKDGTIQTKLSRFLFKYRITPHSTTGQAPSELMFGRRLHSHFDNLHPDLDNKVRGSQEKQKQAHDAHARVREFKIGDLVYARNYSTGPTWIPGTVTKVNGSVTYHVQLDDGREIRRHADQLRSRVGDSTPEASTGEKVIPQDEDVDFPVADNNSPSDESGEEASPTAPATNQPAVPDATNTAGDTAGEPPPPEPPEPQRRSARQHVMPDRYGSPVIYWSPVVYWHCH